MVRIHRWVLTDRQKRTFRNAGIVILALIGIGILPPLFWVFLVSGVGYGLWRFALRVRRERHEEGRRRRF